jgi:glutamine---fructose-6-phosphate transaminase (isomerizing)
MSALLAEIREQPEVLRRAATGRAEIAAAATEIARRDPRLIRLVGHGSSDNAATFGTYALGLLPGLTAVRESISLSVYYGTELAARDSCVIALSQSGRTPDVVAYVEGAAARGLLCIAVTNDGVSPLAAAAHIVLPLRAGAEIAVAATKTYTAQVATLVLLAAALAGRLDEYADALEQTADVIADWLPVLEPRLVELAPELAPVTRMIVIGRGIEYATAREVALKLFETCRVAAAPLTATDLAHGPVAALDPLFPVWAVAGDDATLPTVVEAAARARAAGAHVVATGAAAAAVAHADVSIPTPAPPAPLLAPLLSIVPGQLLAWALAAAKGLDPDRPAGLSKVTLAP